jgi:hypothetical protein
MSLSRETLAYIRGQITDTNGRPVVYDEKAHALVPNMLPGREGHPTDIIEYREFQRKKESVTALFQFFRSSFPDQTISAQDLSYLCAGLYNLPVYLALRRVSSVDKRRMPPSLLDARAAVAGIFPIALHMFNTGMYNEVNADQIYDFANGNNDLVDNNNSKGRNFFVSTDGKLSCPAPEMMVKQMLRQLIEPSFDSLDISTADWFPYISEEERLHAVSFGLAFAQYNDLLSVFEQAPAGGVMSDFINTAAELQKCRELMDIILG